MSNFKPFENFNPIEDDLPEEVPNIISMVLTRARKIIFGRTKTEVQSLLLMVLTLAANLVESQNIATISENIWSGCDDDYTRAFDVCRGILSRFEVPQFQSARPQEFFAILAIWQIAEYLESQNTVNSVVHTGWAMHAITMANFVESFEGSKNILEKIICGNAKTKRSIAAKKGHAQDESVKADVILAYHKQRTSGQSVEAFVDAFREAHRGKYRKKGEAWMPSFRTISGWVREHKKMTKQ